MKDVFGLVKGIDWGKDVFMDVFLGVVIVFKFFFVVIGIWIVVVDFRCIVMDCDGW